MIKKRKAVLAMANKHYVVQGTNIIVEIEKLTEKELQAVKNYQTLGYTLLEMQKPKKEAKKEWTKEAVTKFIKQYATAEQKKTFEELINKQAIDRKTGKPKFKKDGSPMKVGLIGCFSWLKEEFPNYPKPNTEE